MNKLAELRQKLADLKSEGQTLCDAADADNRDLTEDEDARFAEIETQITATQDDITRLEKVAERRRTMDGVAVGSQPAPGNHAVRDRNPEMTGGFADIGEFVNSVVGAVKAQQIGGNIDQRLGPLAATHQGGGGHGEGYMLPPQFRDEVWTLVNQFDEFGPLIDEEPTSARTVKIGADETTPWGSAGIKAYWRAEGSKMSETELADDGRDVPLHELYVLATATEELLEDAPRLNNRLTRKSAEAIAWKKNAAIVEGTGVGQPLGWMKGNSLITVPKESGQAADTIVAENVIKMFSRLQMLPGDRPFWMVNQDTLPQIMTMTVGDRPIWMPPNGLEGAPGGFLMGRPIRFSEFSETLGDKGDVQLISPKGYYGVRRSQGVKFASSIHLYFDYGKQAFRWMFRYGGQPHLSKPITPAKGNATRAHFVTLAERA